MECKTMEEQKAELLRRKAQLENRLKALEAKQTVQERKDDTRRKILAGAIVLHHAKLKPDFKKWLTGELNPSLRSGWLAYHRLSRNRGGSHGAQNDGRTEGRAVAAQGAA